MKKLGIKEIEQIIPSGSAAVSPPVFPVSVTAAA